MNVIGHEHVSPDPDAKVSCAPAIFDEGSVYFTFCEQAGARVSIKCHKVN